MHALALADKEEEHVGLLASANEMKVTRNSTFMEKRFEILPLIFES